MTKSAKPYALGLGLILLALIAIVVDIARFCGVFRAFDGEFAGSCGEIALAGSSEDIQLDSDRGIAYLSVLDRDSVAHGEPVKGSVMLLDLNIAAPAPRAALAHDPPGFRPHGLSLLLRADEPARLFAISHRPDGTHTVEIATRNAGGEFVPDATVRDAAFVHPNALAALGPRQFYLVNDSVTHGGLGRFLEARYLRGRGTLVYYDGAAARVVASGLKFPAGIALSPDGARLYVGEALARQLRVYRRDPASGGVVLDETVPLHTAPDNLNVDADGVVWIAAHPKLLAFVRHARDAARRAPTQVLRFDPRGPEPAAGAPDARLTQVYGDRGSRISAATVAAHWRGEFLLGALLDPKVLICKPKP